MSTRSYDAFFSTATGGQHPYAYQCRLAFGAFRLAYFAAPFRAADIRASIKAKEIP
jgi:hypothetical protein